MRLLLLVALLTGCLFVKSLGAPSLTFSVNTVPILDNDNNGEITPGDIFEINSLVNNAEAVTYTLTQPISPTSFILITDPVIPVKSGELVDGLAASQTVPAVGVTGRTLEITHMVDELSTKNWEHNVDYTFEFSAAKMADGFYPLDAASTCSGGKFKVLPNGYFSVVPPVGFVVNSGNGKCNKVNMLSAPTLAIKFFIVHKPTSVKSAEYTLNIPFAAGRHLIFVDNSYTGSPQNGLEASPFSTMQQFVDTYQKGAATSLALNSESIVILKGTSTPYTITNGADFSVDLELSIFGTSRSNNLANDAAVQGVSFATIPQSSIRPKVFFSGTINPPKRFFILSVDVFGQNKEDAVLTSITFAGQPYVLCVNEVSFHKAKLTYDAANIELKLGDDCEVKVPTGGAQDPLLGIDFFVDEFTGEELVFGGIKEGSFFKFAGPVTTSRIAFSNSFYAGEFLEKVTINVPSTQFASYPAALQIAPTSANTAIYTMVFKKEVVISGPRGILFKDYTTSVGGKPKVEFRSPVAITATGAPPDIFGIKVTATAAPGSDTAITAATFKAAVLITNSAAHLGDAQKAVGIWVDDTGSGAATSALSYALSFESQITIANYNIGILANWLSRITIGAELKILNYKAIGIQVLHNANAISAPGRGNFITGTSAVITQTAVNAITPVMGINVKNNVANFKVTFSSLLLSAPLGTAVEVAPTGGHSPTLMLGQATITAKKGLVVNLGGTVILNGGSITITNAVANSPANTVAGTFVLENSLVYSQSGGGGSTAFSISGTFTLNAGGTFTKSSDPNSSGSEEAVFDCNGCTFAHTSADTVTIVTNSDSVLRVNGGGGTSFTAKSWDISGKCDSTSPKCSESYAISSTIISNINFDSIKISENEISNRLGISVNQLTTKAGLSVHCKFENNLSQRKYCVSVPQMFGTQVGAIAVNCNNAIVTRNCLALKATHSSPSSPICISIDASAISPEFYVGNQAAAVGADKILIDITGPGASLQDYTFTQLVLKSEDIALQCKNLINGKVANAIIDMGVTPTCTGATCYAINIENAANMATMNIVNADIRNFPIFANAKTFGGIRVAGLVGFTAGTGIVRITNVRNIGIFATGIKDITIQDFDISVVAPPGMDHNCVLIDKGTGGTFSIGKGTSSAKCSSATPIPVKAVRLRDTVGGNNALVISGLQVTNMHVVHVSNTDKTIDVTINNVIATGIKFETVATLTVAILLQNPSQVTIVDNVFQTDANVANIATEVFMIQAAPPATAVATTNEISRNTIGGVFGSQQANAYNLVALQYADLPFPVPDPTGSPYKSKTNFFENVIRASIAYKSIRGTNAGSEKLQNAEVKLERNRVTLEGPTASKHFISMGTNNANSGSPPFYCFETNKNVILNVCDATLKIIKFSASTPVNLLYIKPGVATIEAAWAADQNTPVPLCHTSVASNLKDSCKL